MTDEQGAALAVGLFGGAALVFFAMSIELLSDSVRKYFGQISRKVKGAK